MRTYKHRFEVAATIEAVACFHSDSRILKFLSPPGMMIHFHKVQPIVEGAVTDFTIWLGPIPTRWVVTHSDVEKLKGFTDEQIKGPFAYWKHKHSFDALGDNRSLVVDEIQAEPGNNIFDGLISRLMWIGLPILFAYRSWRTKRFLE